MRQTRRASLVESCANVGLGFGLGLAGQVVFLPLLGVEVRLGQNLAFALIMTAISLSRAYLLRRLFEALHIRRPLSSFAQAALAERIRQIEAEGFDQAHDDRHHFDELAGAAAAYLVGAGRDRLAPGWWPWSEDWFKPQSVRRDLVRGAALALAAGDRLDRAQKRTRISAAGKISTIPGRR